MQKLTNNCDASVFLLKMKYENFVESKIRIENLIMSFLSWEF